MSDLVCPYCSSKNESSSIFCLQCGSLLLEDTELENIESQEEEIEKDEESTIFESFVICGGMILSFFIAYWLIGFKLVYNDDILSYFIYYIFNISFLLVVFVIIFSIYLFVYAILAVTCEQIYEKYFLQVNIENGS